MPTIRFDKRRRGFTYLETQVAMVLFMMSLSGVVPIAVIQTRQLAHIQSRIEPNATQYLIPSQSPWAQKLGAPAILSDEPPPPTTTPVTVVSHFDPITIDDLDEGYSERNKSWPDWFHFYWPDGYGSDITLNYPDNANDKARWEFKNLPQGKYDVMVTYPVFAFGNRKAEYEFTVNGEGEGDKNVDQTKPIDDEFVDGVYWKKLKTLDADKNNSRIRVELSDKKATGYNVIDAMRLVPEPPKMFLHEINAPLDENFLEVQVHVDFP